MADARVTQETVLVGSNPDPKARITQESVLVGANPDPKARVSQVTILVGTVTITTQKRSRAFIIE